MNEPTTPIEQPPKVTLTIGTVQIASLMQLGRQMVANYAKQGRMNRFPNAYKDGGQYRVPVTDFNAVLIEDMKACAARYKVLNDAYRVVNGHDYQSEDDADAPPS